MAQNSIPSPPAKAFFEASHQKGHDISPSSPTNTIASTSINPPTSSLSASFPQLWQKATHDNNLTLYGFRRYKTSHLLNLRFLEQEIQELDYKIYQSGLSLNLPLSSTDRLGLQFCKRDSSITNPKEGLDHEIILRLRTLIKEYDEALIAFNAVMNMETFSLADDHWHSSTYDSLTPEEKRKARLIRVDSGTARSTRSAVHKLLSKTLRFFWHSSSSSRSRSNSRYRSNSVSFENGGPAAAYQDTSRYVDLIARFIIALFTATFLIGPLAILSFQSSKTANLVTVSLCILLFTFIVCISVKASIRDTIAATAAYAAVLSVFVSNYNSPNQ